MKFRAKSIVSLSILLVLSLVFLAACGNGAGNGGSAEGGNDGGNGGGNAANSPTTPAGNGGSGEKSS
ncbi:hypothetical protein HMSSN036_90720 [Paenibacillus macerans]|nr:hypothetical protein HMSSN036_90720 [Paenibacillus macerans]